MPQLDSGSLALLLSILGILLTFGLYFLAKRDADPRWVMSTTKIIDLDAHAIPDVEVRFHGAEIRRLSSATIVFWNAGRAPISKADISKASPLRLEVAQPDTELLDAELIAVTNDACGVTIAPITRRKAATIAFEYLNHKDGFAMKVIHSGPASQASVELRGGVRGSRGLFYSVGTWWPFWIVVSAAWVPTVLMVVTTWPASLPTWPLYVGVIEYPLGLLLIFLVWWATVPPKKIQLKSMPDYGPRPNKRRGSRSALK